MLSTTIEVIKSVLKTDTSIDVGERSRLIAMFRRGTDTKDAAPATPACPRLLRRKQVAERLGVSLRTVDNLAIAKSLHRVKLPGRTRSVGFLETDVVALMDIRPEGSAA